ncbi:MAG: response regulator, partial [Candidatus Omnitrophota bacterium]|nr:response regulator [Candidatus Omnitrophota bacterium]
KMKESPVDLVFLDIKMPIKDGIQTLKALKKINPSAKVIVATGYKSVDMAQEASRAGASDYITKPFDREQVLATARSLS